MKKALYFIIATVTLLSFVSCQEKVGSEPGENGSPVVTAYLYAPSSDYNSDEDVLVRFIGNNKVKSAKYFVELKSAKEAAIEAEGEKAYIDKVLEQGKDIEFEDGVYETVLVGMPNYYDISFVAINGSKKVFGSATFKGLAWKAGSMGTFNFTALPGKGLAPASKSVELQQCEFDDNLYRLKDIFGTDCNLKIKFTGEKADGMDLFRVEEQSCGLLYNENKVFVADFGYAFDEAYFYDYGYNCGKKPDGTLVFTIKYYTAAGTVGLAYGGAVETYVPNP